VVKMTDPSPSRVDRFGVPPTARAGAGLSAQRGTTRQVLRLTLVRHAKRV